MDNVCRFCLEHIVRKKATSIGNHQFKSMVRRVFPFEIDYDEKLPMKVCGKCFSVVREFHWYSQKVQAVQELLERQFYTTENESSCSVSQAVVDDDNAGNLRGSDEQIGFGKCDHKTPTEKLSDVVSISSDDTQHTEQDAATPANHIDSRHCLTDCSDSYDSENDTNEKPEGQETESMQCDVTTNNNQESITATIHESQNERFHAEVDKQSASVTEDGQRNELLAYSAPQATEYDQSGETMNDYFQGLSEIVISDTAGWFEDVQNIICEEVPLLQELEIFNSDSFAGADKSVVQEAKPNESSQLHDQPTVAPYPCAAVTFQVAQQTATHEKKVVHYKEGLNSKESEEMDYGYEQKSSATMGVSLEDLNPSDGTEHQIDSSMNNPQEENDQAQELHDATESVASGMCNMDATTAGACVGSQHPTYLKKHERTNGHFKSQDDGSKDEHNHSDLIDHVQEVPYEEEVYSEEAANQSLTIVDHATVREVSTKQELGKIPVVAKSVFVNNSNAQPTSNKTQAVVISSSSSGFMDAFSKFVEQQKPPVESYNNSISILESKRQATVASMSSSQQNLPTKKTTLKKDNEKASNELDNAIEKYFDLQCELCPQITEECFTTFDKLTAHFRKVHDIRGYARCCGKQFFYRRQLMDHIDYHRGLLRCSVCDRSFTTRAAMKQHENVYHKPTKLQFPCTECRAVCDTQHELSVHKSLMHNRVPSETHENQDQRTKDCKTCGASFISEQQLNNHMMVHCGNENETKLANTRPCLHCSKVFRTEKRFNSHMLLYHPRHVFSCDLCSFSSPNMSLLRKHKLNKHAAIVPSRSKTLMTQSERRLTGVVYGGKAHISSGFVGSENLLALHSHQQHRSDKTIYSINSNEAKNDDNKAKEARFDYSTP